VPNVGEAFYEITARDAGLVQSLGRAEGKIRSTGRAAEGIGDSTTKGLDNAGRAGGRFGGVLDRLRGKIRGTSSSMKSLGQGALSGIGVAGFLGVAAAATAAVGAIGKSISAASDLSETVSKVGVVFEKNGDDVLAWSEDSAKAFGLSKNAALGAAATYGNLFTAMGLTVDKSAEMSTGLVELAADLASFNNVDPTEALQALQSGLVGEVEPLRRFGVQLSQARIQQEALRLGLVATTAEMTPAIKTQASYSLILQDTTKAQGDFARTADGLANQQRIAAAEVENAFARLGESLVPIAAQIVPALAGAFTVALDALGGMIRFIQRNVKPVLLALGVVLLALLPTIWGIAAGVIAATWPFLALAAVVAAFALAYETNFLGIRDITDAVFSVVANVIGFIFGLVKGIAEAFLTVAEAIVGAAASIPGPWQDAAAGMAASLGDMKAAVHAWGQETLAETRETGEAVPDAVADGLAAGIPGVSEAAGAMVEPIPGAMEDAKNEAKKTALKTPGEIASSLREGRDSVTQAGNALTDALKNAISPQKEIAKLEAELTGDEMARGLRSKDQNVRAAAEAYKRQIEERLFALRNGVPEYARQTGQSYADALAAKKVEITNAARSAVAAAGAHWKEQKGEAAAFAKATMQAYAKAIRARREEITRAAKYAVAGARAILEAGSPPKSPDSPLHEIDKWGSRTMLAYADAVAGEAGALREATGRFLAGGRAEFDRTGANPVLPLPRPPVGPVGDRSVSVEINIPITFTGGAGAVPSRYDIQQIGRDLADHVRLGLIRSGIPAGTG